MSAEAIAAKKLLVDGLKKASEKWLVPILEEKGVHKIVQKIADEHSEQFLIITNDKEFCSQYFLLAKSKTTDVFDLARRGAFIAKTKCLDLTMRQLIDELRRYAIKMIHACEEKKKKVGDQYACLNNFYNNLVSLSSNGPTLESEDLLKYCSKDISTTDTIWEACNFHDLIGTKIPTPTGEEIAYLFLAEKAHGFCISEGVSINSDRLLARVSDRFLQLLDVGVENVYRALLAEWLDKLKDVEEAKRCLMDMQIIRHCFAVRVCHTYLE